MSWPLLHTDARPGSGARRVRLAALLVVVALAATVAISGAPAAHADHLPGPCALDRQQDETIRHYAKRLITCATDRWSVPGGAEKAICIADRESGLNPAVTSADGKYLGLFQHAKKAWPDRFQAWTESEWELSESALSGRSNAIVTIRMVHADGWGPWAGVNC